MTKRVAILQSNYIPWKGYFDIIHDVDTFIFYDDVQYTVRDWRNRNLIKTESGEQWLSVPVGNDRNRRICDVMLPADRGWAEEHWRRIVRAYRSAPYFEMYRPHFESIYLGGQWSHLAEMNQAMTEGISRDLLGITARFEHSTDYRLTGSKGDRILDLLRLSGATTYVSGPAARAYLSEQQFASAGVEAVWKDYTGYPEYPQLHGPFRHQVTILDLLFQVGPTAPWHIWGWRVGANKGVAA